MFFEWAAHGAQIGVEILFALITLAFGIGAVLAVAWLVSYAAGGTHEKASRRD